MYKFYMVLIQQMKDVNPIYGLHLIILALEDPEINSIKSRNEDIDILYKRLYDSAS